MKLFTANMNMSQKMLDGLIDCELGLFGSMKRDRTLFDLQKTFYSAAAFNPTFPDFRIEPGAGTRLRRPVRLQIHWPGWTWTTARRLLISVRTPA